MTKRCKLNLLHYPVMSSSHSRSSLLGYLPLSQPGLMPFRRNIIPHDGDRSNSHIREDHRPLSLPLPLLLHTLKCSTALAPVNS